MKKIVIAILLLGLATGGYYSYKAITEDSIHTNGFNVIPNDAIFILETDQPIKNWKKFSSSPFWKFISNHPSMNELDTDADYLDSLLASNERIASHIGDRLFLLSAHMTHKYDYDFLFTIDLQNSSKLKLTETLLESILDKEYFSIKSISGDKLSYFEVIYKPDNEQLFLAKNHNYLVCSYTKSLLEKSLKMSKHESLQLNEKFWQTYQNTDDNGFARLFVQYSFLDEYLRVYTQNNKSSLEALSTSFTFSAFDIQLSNEQASLSGFTTLPDSNERIPSLLQKYGNNKLTFQSIFSSRTAYAQALALKKFDQFYEDVLTLKQRDKNSIHDYISVKNKVEKVLGLNLQEDIISWIGDEIVFSRNRISSSNPYQEDYIAAIKATDIEFANEKLTKIQKRTRKRTPAKFKKMEYKNYDIFYLDIKGFFGLFWGEAFKKITKPYYTIIDDFVVFSNNPISLVSMIEDYENGAVLSQLPSFENLYNQLPKEVTLFTYINGELAYDAISKNIQSSSKNEFKKNKKYFNYFKSIGLTFTATNGGFTNEIQMFFGDENKVDIPEIQSIDSLESAYFEDLTSKLNSMSETELFVFNQIQNETYIKKFAGSNQVYIKAETKKGKLHGKYLEYYRNGNIRVRGKYRKGRKKGKWFYYSIDGVLSEKAWEGI